MEKTIPKREEINVFYSLDEREACKHFLGKNLADAEELLRENPLFYQEDLMWMGPIAFRYYVAAAVNLIRREARPDSDLLNCMAGILEFRLQRERLELVDVAPVLSSLSSHVVNHWNRCDVDPLYGDLRERYVELAKVFSILASQPQT